MGFFSKDKEMDKKVCKTPSQEVLACKTHVCEQKVREIAYYRWEEAGRPEGREEEFWLEAEKEAKKV